MFLVSSCSCLCSIYWIHVLSWEWRCSWCSADRRCSNYIWAINNSIARKGTSYIRDLTVSNFRSDNSDHMIISCEIYLKWMPQNNFDDESSLVQVMVWCPQAASYYMDQAFLGIWCHHWTPIFTSKRYNAYESGLIMDMIFLIDIYWYLILAYKR